MDQELERLIWSDYHEHTRPDQVPGMEKYSPDKFKREYQVYRLTHLPGKVVSISNRTQLPNGSMLHLLDDWMFDEHSDTIRPDAHFFIRAESYPTYIYHIKEPNLKDPISVTGINYIYNQAKLPTNLMAFRSLHTSRFKYVNSKDEIPQKPTTFTVVNHNPINRVRVLGKMRGFNRFQLILSSILNTMCDLSDLRKQQWLFIPWGEDVYDKMSFLKSREALTPTSVQYPDNFQWLMQMHLYNYMLPEAKTSIFDQIPDRIKPQINLILNLNDKYLFYNLKDLKEMSNQTGAFVKFTNQIDLLSTLGRISHDGRDDGIPEEATNTIQTIKGVSSKPIPIYSDKKPVDKATDEVTINEGTSKEQVVSQAEMEHIVEYDIQHPDITAAIKGRGAPLVPGIKQRIIKRLDELIPKSKICILSATSVGYQLPNPHQIIPPEEAKTDMHGKVHLTDELEPVLNSTKVNLDTDLKTDELISKEYYKDMQEATKEYIENREELTPKQKERYHKLSKKWEECKLGGVPLKTLLLDRDDIGLDHESIPESLVGELPDKSALKSSISALDRDYMDKTFPKHIAAILTSFSKNGVFLVDLKEEKIVNELQNVTQYSATYEDIKGKRSTVKFAIPNVDRDGKVKIDGVTQVLKKQKINLPIVKISDTIVSLASNQNKTRVERNCNKAHSYFSFVEGLINGPKSNAKVTYGKSQVNLPISYEYATIGERFKIVEFKHGSDNWSLYFDYNTRDTHFNGKPMELIQLEAQYGTYFGRTNNDWVFVDNQNTVTAVRQKGGENVEMGEYKSITQILMLSLKPGESYDKTLTEWCNVKILDAFLPVIFLLGYRYGLRKMLDYMKVKYTITEKRSKVIVGENPVPGTEDYREIMDHGSHAEMFGAHVNTVTPVGEDPFEGTDWIKIAGQEAAYQMVADVPPTETKSTIEIQPIPMKEAAKTVTKIPHAPKLSTSKIKGLDVVKKLNIPNTDMLIGASAAMILWGIKKDANRDLDVSVSEKYMKKLMQDGKLTTQMENGIPHCVLKDSPSVEIDFGIIDPKFATHFEDMVRWGTVIVDGFRFFNIMGLFRFYFYLLTHASTKEKHEKRVKQITDIRNAVSDWFDHKCYHGTPVSGLKEISAKVAASYKKMGPLVFATYYKIIAMVHGYWWKDDMIHMQTVTQDDGISITINLTIQRTLNEAELSVPFSVYTLSDKDFDHLMQSTEDPLMGSHPIKEIIHKGNVKVLKEEKYPSWWDAMLALEKEGYVSIKNKNRVTKTKLLKGVGPSDPASIETPESDAAEDVPALPISADIRYAPMYGDIPIKFADRILWINRYPLAHSLIVAGLDMFDLTAYNMSDFESKDVYYKLLQDKGLSINYLKGIDSFFDLFIDPITYNNLKMMNEPTDMRDLLIRSVVLLTTLDARPPSSSKNFRVRGYEQFAAVLYNEMARHYAAYSNQRGKAAQFSLPPDAVYLRILQNAAMLNAEAANPLENMKEASYLTHVGIGGRTAESFVFRDRRVTKDDTGIMSESTTDNGKVGVNAYLTYDPGVANTMGILDPKKIDEQDPGNSFSVFALVYPWATQDDKLCEPSWYRLPRRDTVVYTHILSASVVILK